MERESIEFIDRTIGDYLEMVDKIIKVNFQDGDMKIYKNILEYVSGLYYFFMVQIKEGRKVAVHIDRNDISNIETKYKGSWKNVSLKKRN